MKIIFKKYYTRLQWFFNYTRNLYHLQSAREIERLKKEALCSLNKAEHKIYSQHGEDGIIAEIFNRIGATSKTFFEFGAGGGSENNTIALLLRGWNGWWIDGGDYVGVYRTLFADSITRGDLHVAKSFISSGNINTIVRELNIPQEIDFLSIDIDSNDYYVWKALNAVNPRVVCIEYNAGYPYDMHFLQDDSITEWNGSNFFGASLYTMNALAQEKGYTLVCCDIIGANAFFVRKDLVGDKFDYAGDAQKLWQPPRYYLHYYGGHPPTVRYGETPSFGKWVPLLR